MDEPKGALPPFGRAVLDVRGKGAYARAHLAQSVSLPRHRLEFDLSSRITARSTPIELYADDDELAELAGATVREMGYERVAVLSGALACTPEEELIQGTNVVSKAFAEQLARKRHTPSINADELAEALRRGDDLVIYDVRPAKEYAAGHVPGAINLTTGELILAPERIDAERVVLHCGGRTRAIMAAELLREVGLEGRVAELENGTAGWLLSGRRLEVGEGKEHAAVVIDPLAEPAPGMALPAPLITSEELEALWEGREDRNVVVLDCRSETEFEAGHVPGAIHLPLVQVLQAIDDYVAVADTSIVLTCDTTRRSGAGARWLGEMGFSNAVALFGGIGEYERRIGPLEQGWRVVEAHGLERARTLVPRAEAGELAGALVVSFDESDDYLAAHVKGATWIPRGRLELLAKDVLPDPAGRVVVASSDEAQSLLGASTLFKLGYRNVGVLAGPLEALARQGLELESGPERLAAAPDDVVPSPAASDAALRRYLAWEEALDDDGRSPVDLWHD